MLIVKFFFLCLVFPEDFIDYDNKMNCRIKSESVLKEFTYPNDIISNEQDARNLCKKYCGSQKKCRGCSFSCSSRCQWIAVTDCDLQTSSENLLNSSFTQKPGKQIKN